MSALLEQIKTRGHWRVVIRPQCFSESHINDYQRLYDIVRESAVELRGWDFPHIDMRTPPIREQEWVGQETDWNHYREIWRFYRSGQFIFLGGYEQDWRDRSGLWPSDPNWQPGKHMGVLDTLYSITEFLEFASRLSATEAGAGRMVVEIEFHGLQGRRIHFDHRNVDPTIFADPASASDWSWARTFLRAELASEGRDAAVQAANDLFARYGWGLSEDDARKWQEELYGFKKGR